MIYLKTFIIIRSPIEFLFLNIVALREGRDILDKFQVDFQISLMLESYR